MQGQHGQPEHHHHAKALRAPLLKVLPPPLPGCLVVIPYYPLNDEMTGASARVQLGRIAKRVQANCKVPFGYDDGVVKLIANRCTELGSRTRVIATILINTVTQRVIEEILTRMMGGDSISRVQI